VERKIKIYLAGDSTVTHKHETPYAGWGQMLGEFFNKNISICNQAESGRSTRSFIREGRFDNIKKLIKTGDYLFIQFGHNDQKQDDRYTDPYTTYSENLKTFIKMSRDVGAIPILVTPVFRRLFCDAGILYDTHVDYAKAVRKVAIDENVVLIDLHKKSGDLLEELGVVASKDIFLHIKAGIYDHSPNGIEDDTHFSEYGARVIAKLIVDEIENKIPDLADYLN